MKKLFLVVLLAAMFIGKMSIGEWEKIPQQEEFVRYLGVMLCREMDCEEGNIETKKVGKNILFFWECLDPKPGSEPKKSKKTNL
ncbi:hypothetical protein A3J77_00685 [Candidatus Wolfebacteria bacterium RBG_13_41_7]|uniref:Uncharacterized protein n=1 Tax=Candidatus Wolfebacteria bacterium RBG_13_41_7 TaxID=1802554 RepID=A0A1F8DQP3_9BACT|nr:MAG: hypothetical protein A3J77_00685 [Candidatus Wolfebacteria bacterium RBG_13_41_7]